MSRPLTEESTKANTKQYPKDFDYKKKGPPPPPPKPLKDRYDYVNPSHYVHDDGKQTWEQMVDIWGVEKTILWMEMTVFKYQSRIGKKPGEHDNDLKKIEWYNNKIAELYEHRTKH